MEYIEVKPEEINCLICKKSFQSGDNVYTIKNKKNEPTAFIHSECLIHPPGTKTITVKKAINFGVPFGINNQNKNEL